LCCIFSEIPTNCCFYFHNDFQILRYRKWSFKVLCQRESITFSIYSIERSCLSDIEEYGVQ